ncbi:MAG: biotin attachment protein [Erythrobacter sp. RIFCSPHIGHO2_12_FULL_63_10]|nr:MAG: biotin attachment protein [Erythrobacter sp. RIFCSPHIGHO2_12_FULL_63_10]
MSEIIVPTDLWDDDSLGVISTWLFEDGDAVSQGDIVAEVMNEKISFDIAAPASGTLAIDVPTESEVSQGDAIGRILSA